MDPSLHGDLFVHYPVLTRTISNNESPSIRPFCLICCGFCPQCWCQTYVYTLWIAFEETNSIMRRSFRARRLVGGRLGCAITSPAQKYCLNPTMIISNQIILVGIEDMKSKRPRIHPKLRKCAKVIFSLILLTNSFSDSFLLNRIHLPQCGP